MTSLTDTESVSIKGQIKSVSAIKVGNVSIVVAKHGLLMAAVVRDEDYVKPSDLPDPTEVARAVKEARLKVDVVLVGQDFRRPEPLYSNLPAERDNVAAVALTSYDRWLSDLSQSTRRNVRLAGRAGVVAGCTGDSGSI